MKRQHKKGSSRQDCFLCKYCLKSLIQVQLLFHKVFGKNIAGGARDYGGYKLKYKGIAHKTSHEVRDPGADGNGTVRYDYFSQIGRHSKGGNRLD